jgi:hypothetical protein
MYAARLLHPPFFDFDWISEMMYLCKRGDYMIEQLAQPAFF